MYKKIISIAAAGVILSSCITAFADMGKRGDLNGDGAVTITDVSMIAAHVKNKKKLDPASLPYADVNFDGKVNVTDVSAIAAHVKGIKSLPYDPNGADETFEGCDAYLIFADKNMNWGNWNGQGYHGVPSYGIDADIVGDGTYSVSITRESITSPDDTGANPSLVYDEYWGGERYLRSPEGCTIMCVDITGLLDGTLGADGSELEGFLEEGEDPNINKKVKGKFRGDNIKVTVESIKADGYDISFNRSKIRYGNLDEEDNCYRIEIVNGLTRSAEDAAINVDTFSFWNSIEITFSISGIGDLTGNGRETDPEE